MRQLFKIFKSPKPELQKQLRKRGALCKKIFKTICPLHVLSKTFRTGKNLMRTDLLLFVWTSRVSRDFEKISPQEKSSQGIILKCTK